MINIIAAVAIEGTIGINGRLPWKLNADMKRFKELTWGGVVIFGVNTFNELEKPLEGRTNVILSHRVKSVDGAFVFDSFDAALAFAKSLKKEIFICGGESVYKQAIPLADRLYITHVNESFDGDRRFPDIPSYFKCMSSQDVLDTGVSTTFRIYDRQN